MFQSSPKLLSTWATVLFQNPLKMFQIFNPISNYTVSSESIGTTGQIVLFLLYTEGIFVYLGLRYEEIDII